MAPRIQLVAIIGAVVLLVAVLEMVRRRRLMERYALLWLLSAAVLIALASWSGALETISHAIGIIYPPNALFFVAFAFVLLLLLHFSAAVSRLSDQSKVLAQRLALLDERVRRAEARAPDVGVGEEDEGATEKDREDDALARVPAGWRSTAMRGGAHDRPSRGLDPH